ncbi:MAG: ferritin-like fold-containing protein [Naasia sp.]
MHDVDLDPVALLGRAAYVQLAQFTALSRAAAEATSVQAKGSLADAAGRLLESHRALVAALEARGVVASEAMHPFVAPTDRFFQAVSGANWHEALTSCYLVDGLLDDFYSRLLAGLEPDGRDLAAHLTGPRTSGEIVGVLSAAIAADARLGSRLAVWGRRLVGDTLLCARAALPETVRTEAGEARIEPVLTELMAEHTRRMDRLGLTA